MNILSQVAHTMQTVLTTAANYLGRKSGFIRRERKFTGEGYVQTLVFGWLANPDATLEQLCQMAATLGIQMTPQSLEERFSRQSSEFMRQVLAAGVEQLIASSPVAIPLLQRFNGVYLQDSSTIRLPDELKEIWIGCGGSDGSNTASSVKLHVRWDVLHGTLIGPMLQHGKDADLSSPLQPDTLPQGSLRLTDLGYFSLDDLEQLKALGVYWLTRLKSQSDFYDEHGTRWDLVTFLQQHTSSQIDMPILLGAKKRVPCRLLGERVPDEVANARRRRIRLHARKKGIQPTQKILFLAGWTLLVTTVEPSRLSLTEAHVLMRTRWQIELLFKLWKTYGHVDTSRSQKPWRILTEVYAKLLGMLLQHWIFLTSCWSCASRSLMKASATVRSHACTIALAFALGSLQRLLEALETIQRCLSQGCRLNKRKQNPNTYQLLLGGDIP